MYEPLTTPYSLQTLFVISLIDLWSALIAYANGIIRMSNALGLL